MRHLRCQFLIVSLSFLLLTSLTACTQVASAPTRPDIILATTTSTRDSGLLDVLVPDFEQKTGYIVKTIAVGTGQALEMGEKGDADLLFVHAPPAEKERPHKSRGQAARGTRSRSAPQEQHVDGQRQQLATKTNCNQQQK